MDPNNDFDPSQSGFDNLSRKPMNNLGGKKIKGGTIVLGLVLILIAAVVLVIVLDVGNVRSEHIAGYLRNMPLVGGLFSDVNNEDDPLYEMTEEQMRQKIRDLTIERNGARDQRDEFEKDLEAANALNAHLSVFQAQWNEFRNASALFTQMLANNEPINFVEFFQRIVEHDLVPADLLAMAYGQARVINAFDEEFQRLVSTYNNMEAGRAAEDLDRLRLTDTALAVRLLRAMGPTRRAEIFDEMEYTVSSSFAILLQVTPPTFAPLIAPPQLPEIVIPDTPILPPAPSIPVEEDDEYESEDEETEDEFEEEGEYTEE